MSDATVVHLRPRALVPVAPRDCGMARVLALPTTAHSAGRLIEPLSVMPSARARVTGEDPRSGSSRPGPLARALLAMAVGGR